MQLKGSKNNNTLKRGGRCRLFSFLNHPIMKKLLQLALVLSIASTAAVHAQPVHDGIKNDSTTFTFEQNDSLERQIRKRSIDTAGAQLWKIGTTSKSFFAQGMSSDYAIMTDTSQPYPVNADDWFTLKLLQGSQFNVIIGFWHKYQTTSNQDGGVVEYSKDGFNWLNVLDSCNVDTMQWTGGGISTENFYGPDDTLANGMPAFTGTSNGWQYSRFQFFFGLPVKGTAIDCLPDDSAYVRFRFISDNTAESLDGWIIDKIQIEDDHYSAVKDLASANNYVTIYPNPAKDVLNIKMDKEIYHTARIMNTMGQLCSEHKLSGRQAKINVHDLAPGTYFILLGGKNGTTAERIEKQ
jgi:hypothetical protein